jgi:formylglycine-generating enzyme required for sulfatase activity
MDMAGNVAEWTADWYADKYSLSAPPSSGTERVNRGGHWENQYVSSVRSAGRSQDKPGTRDVIIGFRCARDERDVKAP